jgi:tetratricopeptide (TPR) repeat protein
VTAPTPPHSVARTSVLERIEAWMEHSDEAVFLLTGSPGVGKSEIARQAALALDPTYEHRCDAQDDATLNPLRFIGDLACSLADQNTDYARRIVELVRPDIIINSTVQVETLAGGARAQGVVINSLHIADMPVRAAFDRLIRNPIENCREADEHPKPFLVIVDAIDESLGFRPSDHLVDLLLHAASCPGLRFLLTSRSGETSVIDRFGEGTLDLDRHQDGDLLRYAQLRLSGVADLGTSVFAERLAGAGNFLYVRYVLDDLINQPRGVDIAELPLPDGIVDVYRQYLMRTVAPDRRDRDWVARYRPVLGLVAVGRGQGLPIGLIAKASGLPLSATLDVLHDCGQFLTVVGDRPANQRVRIYHRSFQEFLMTDHTYTVFPAEAHSSLARSMTSEYWKDWQSDVADYGLSYLPLHLHEGGLKAQLIALARDPAFLKAQRNERPDDPEIDVTTIRLALDAAIAQPDPALIAEFLLTLATRRERSEARTPLEFLTRYGLSVAVRYSEDLDANRRALNELLLIFHLVTNDQLEDARYLARQLLARKPDRFSGGPVECAALLLVAVAMADGDVAAALSSMMLSTWGRQYLVSHFLALNIYHFAIKVANTIPDMSIRYRTYMAISESMLYCGYVDDAVQLLGSIGESVDPDSEPGANRPLWYIWPEVAWVVGLALAFKGDFTRGEAAFKRAVEVRSQTEVPDFWRASLVAAAGYGEWAQHKKDSALRFLREAEGIAETVVDTDEGDHSKARTWLFIGKVYLWCGLPDEAKRAIHLASSYAPPLEIMQSLSFYESPVHDDAIHGPCLQGLYLELSSVAARAGDIPTALALAAPLIELGARDAVDALVTIAASAHTSPQDIQQTKERALRVLEGLKPVPRIVTWARALWATETTGWSGGAFDLGDADLAAELDRILNPPTGDASPLASALAEVINRVAASTGGGRKRRARTQKKMVSALRQVDGQKRGLVQQVVERLEEHPSRSPAPERVGPDGPYVTVLFGDESRSQQTPQDSAAALSRKAIHSRKNGHFEEARRFADSALATLRAIENEPEADHDYASAFDYLSWADRLHERACIWARLGDHNQAVKLYKKALGQEGNAEGGWMAFQAMAGVPKTVDSIGQDDDITELGRIHRLCRLAGESATADNHEGVIAFLIMARETLSQIRSPRNRSHGAARVASAAITSDAISEFPATLSLITVDRESHLQKIFLIYCDNSISQTRAVLRPEISPVVLELFGSQELAVTACGGLATLFPDDADRIWKTLCVRFPDLLDSRTRITS